ncbi:MAG: hypothetical protein K2N05_01995, partial [Muribaculaceae bacterium]|nr:hypothetical protein [Muribaculaceae bacterium]
NPGGNTGGNGDNPGGNTGGEDPAKNFVLQGEGKDIILPDGQYAHFSLESVKIGTPATGTLFSMRNEYPNLSVNSFYASGQTTTPSIASVGSVGSINEIPYYYYSSPAFSFDRSAVIKDGGYIIKFEKYDTYTYQFTQWVIALFVRETGNHNITFSYRLYTVKK